MFFIIARTGRASTLTASDDVRLSDIVRRFTCTACGKRGADVWPDWQGQASVTEQSGLDALGTHRGRFRSIRVRSMARQSSVEQQLAT